MRLNRLAHSPLASSGRVYPAFARVAKHWQTRWQTAHKTYSNRSSINYFRRKTEGPSSATAAGNARSAATIANKLSEPSDCPAGRRFAAALWLGGIVVMVSSAVRSDSQTDNPLPPDWTNSWSRPAITSMSFAVVPWHASFPRPCPTGKNDWMCWVLPPVANCIYILWRAKMRELDISYAPCRLTT